MATSKKKPAGIVDTIPAEEVAEVQVEAAPAETVEIEVTYEERLAAADAVLAEARAKVDAAKREFETAQAARDAVVIEREANADPQAEGKAGRAWLDRQNEIRKERVLRAQAIADAVGLKAKGAGLSALDQSLINRRRQVPTRNVRLGSVAR